MSYLQLPTRTPGQKVLSSDINQLMENLEHIMSLIHIGDIIMYGKSTAPANFIICNGAAISRTTYATLFAAIGTAYGVGDNSTTFNIPNYQAVAPKGVGNQTINTRVKSGPAFAAVEEDRFQGFKISIVNDIGNQVMVSPGGAVTGSGIANTTYGFANSILASIGTDGTNGTPRLGLTTRENSIGTNFCIRYQ